MKKEINIEKIIKKVQTDADKKSERRFEGMMEVINNNFEKVTEQFKIVFEKLDYHSQTLDSHTEMIGNLTMDMTEVKSDIKDIKSSLDSKVDKKHFVDLDRRVRILEKK